MHKVLIPTKLDKFAANMLTEKGYRVVLDAATPLEEQVARDSDAEVLIVRSEKVTKEIIDALPQLKLVVRAGAGYNTIDTKYARKRNVDVMNTPGANSNAVAEEVIALILAAFRHLLPADASTRAGNWEKSKFMGYELTGKTIGILGLGHIGQLVVKRLAGFEVKVLGYDPMISPARAEEIGAELCTVERIFSEADCITLHIPENEETRGMIDRHLFEMMKPGAMLVNCARAGIINEADLRAVKAEKKIVYCNDVYPKDAPGPKSVADVADIMMPHLGANTFEANFNAARRAAEQTIAYFEQGITNCVVNKALPDGLDAGYQKLAYVLTSLTKAYLGDSNPTRIETSFYGKLADYAKFLVPPVVAAIASDFAVEQGPKEAEQFLADAGVELVNRVVDNSKRYGEAMTIDLFVGNGGTIFKSGARGTITEGQPMISRLDEFDHLYFNPAGYHLFVEYADEPGVLGKIAGILGEKNINIVDIRAPQNPKSGRSLSVVTTNVEVPEMLIAKIKEAVNAKKAFSFSFAG
ncbi:MAG: NAD(P)-binding domain-containing protein [Lentisphaeria bacterium]|nr:NAD(P)-binding domain-containing protein [Lentisphaeria bacterium]